MTLAVRQTLASVRNSATSLARTFASVVLAKSLLIAHGAVFNSGGSGEPTISDNVNSTWSGYATTGYSTSGDADSEIYLWSFPNSAPGTITVTMNPPGASSANDLTIFEVTGAALTSVRDVSVTATGTFAADSGGNTAVATGTLAQANEIVFSSSSHVFGDRTLTEDTADGFTKGDENENNTTGQTFLCQYKIVGDVASITVNVAIGTGTNNDVQLWFSGVASFKEREASNMFFRQNSYRPRPFAPGLGR